MIRAILCLLGLHRWASHILRSPAVGVAYRVRSCSACPARRVEAVAGGAP